jgi:hypothetical protein
MRDLYRVALIACVFLFPAAISLYSQQESFRWIDFHADKDQDIVIWVTHALAGEKWTAIREIGVQWDAALVVTTQRGAADSSPAADTFQIYSVSLKSHLLTPILKGVNLRWVEGLQLSPSAAREPALLYDDCSECAATTYFTAFHYDAVQHIFAARWLRGAQGVPVWTTSTQADVTLSQMYAVLPVVGVGNQVGSEFLAAWSHFDFGKAKPVQDYVFRYDRDPQTGLDRFVTLSGKDADAMKVRLCGVTGAGLARGQDSDLCVGIVPHARAERRVVTTPPAQNQGRSTPPGGKPKHN